MKTKLGNIEPIDSKSLEWKLECATVSSWKDLSTRTIPEQVHLEYHAGAEGKLEHLKMWSSIRRGEWDLVCDYWLVANEANRAGTTFSNGFSSDLLQRSLDSIMKHQDCFPAAVRAPFGLIQIKRPTQEESRLAEQIMAVTPQTAAHLEVRSGS